ADVVEAARCTGRILGDGHLVPLVVRGEPRALLRAVVEHDPLGKAHTERLLQRHAAGADVDGEQVDVVEPAEVAASRREPRGLVLQGRFRLRGRLVPLDVPDQLHDMAIGRAEAVGPAVPLVTVDPADTETRLLDLGHAAIERLRRRPTKGEVLHPRHRAGGQLQGVVSVVVPTPEVDRVALPAALDQAEELGEEAHALVEGGCDEFDVRQVRQVKAGLANPQTHLIHRSQLPSRPARVRPRALRSGTWSEASPLTTDYLSELEPRRSEAPGRHSSLASDDRLPVPAGRL